MTTWWGRFEVPLGEQRYWRIGPASLWAERLPHEWAFASESAGNVDDPVQAAVTTNPTTLLERKQVARFGVADDGTELTLTPALADRPVVTRPVEPFSVPAGHTVTVFVGSPIWLQVSVAGGGPPLIDHALVRPSDTWFGPNTQVGELCYASRTACRLRLADLTLHAHHAATAVTIRNGTSSPLALERLNLPVAHLGLHRAASGVLWTEAVELDHLDSEGLAPLRVAGTPPAVAETVERVAEPRQRAAPQTLVRAFSSLFS